MRVSLIVTTYNWPQALGLTLASVARQSSLPHEVIVADDGSGPETAQSVQRWRAQLACPVRHVWQEDDGFRLARSRNRALAASEGEYIVLVDGDMILHRRFIEDHVACARPDCFIQGARPQLSEPVTQRLLSTGEPDVNVFSPGMERRSYALRSPLLSRFASKVRPTLAGIQGCNQSYWRRHALQVNGYDERFTGWGPEDREFAARLLHIGVMRNYVRHRAIAYHLYHRSRAPSGHNPFDRLLEDTLRTRATRCVTGLDAHLTRIDPLQTDAAVAMC
ncbi:MAG TPA: glycosyltransferase family 2 protein [Steroidobacteraceae bacterium]|nr:glycosyltransferase family 2 protein [Steroidobacteraceae bacterium]